MDKKTLLAIVLSMAVLFVYQTFFMQKPVPPPGQQTEQPATQDKVAKEKPGPAQTPVASTAPSGPSGQAILVAKTLPADDKTPEKDIRVETALYSAAFTNKGASLKSFKLKNFSRELPENRQYQWQDLLALFGQKEKKTIPGAGEPFELVKVLEGMPHPLAVSFPESDVNIPAEAKFETDAESLSLTTGNEGRRLTFTKTFGNEIKVEKIFTLYPDRYNVDLEVRIYNLSTRTLTQTPALNWHQWVDPKAEEDSYGHDGPVTYIGKSIDRVEVKKIEKDQMAGPDVSWAGYESKYFISALVPQNPSLTSLLVGRDAKNMVTVSLKGPKHIIPPGQTGMFFYSLFLGPKDYKILKPMKVGLENAIDFGDWLKWLAMPMLVVLNFLNDYVGNYGIAIIILTILIKIIFWPLGNKSYKSMKEMQRLQPKIAELREKYKTDKSRMSQETMALYRAHKVNPFSGCLPMVIQIPVFFGLYKALMYAIELRHAPFFWWIQDLSAMDPYYITPLIMGGTMFVQQKMTPAMGDPMQQKIMLLMPVIFTFMFLSFPSGLVIYWLLNNVISIGQQMYVIKKQA